jgi:hypothetical protein
MTAILPLQPEYVSDPFQTVCPCFDGQFKKSIDGAFKKRIIILMSDCWNKPAEAERETGFHALDSGPLEERWFSHESQGIRKINRHEPDDRQPGTFGISGGQD